MEYIKGGNMKKILFFILILLICCCCKFFFNKDKPDSNVSDDNKKLNSKIESNENNKQIVKVKITEDNSEISKNTNSDNKGITPNNQISIEPEDISNNNNQPKMNMVDIQKEKNEEDFLEEEIDFDSSLIPQDVIFDEEISLKEFNGILTFDDGPHPKTTLKLINILKQAEVKNAIFFFIGARIREYPKLAKLTEESGYDIGYHSMNHQNLAYLTSKQIDRDIKQFKKILNYALGSEYPLKYGRPPYGGMSSKSLKLFNQMEKNKKLAKCQFFQKTINKLVLPKIVTQFKKHKLKLMLWNVDFDDWKEEMDINYINNITFENYFPRVDQIWLFHEMPIDYKTMAAIDNQILDWLPSFIYKINSIYIIEYR